MTNELGPEARTLLEAAREGLGPDAAAIRRMRAKIDASIAGGAAGAGAGAGTGSGSGPGAGAGTGAGAGAGAGAGTGALALKLGALAAAATVAIVAIVVISRGAGGEAAIAPRVELPAEGARAAATATQLSAREAVPEVPAARATPDEPEIEMAPVRVEPARPAPRAPDAPRAAPVQPAPAIAPATSPPPPVAAPQPPAAPRRADLAREVVLVDQAMAALRRGAPADALDAVRVHAAETAGAGQLAEDAAAIEIEALCRLHEPTVAAKLAAFDAKWPESAQRSRLTARCP